VHCSSHSLRIKATHRRTLKHTRQANQLMVLHLSVPKYHCTDCNRYFRHRFEGIRPRLRATEAYRMEVFEAHDGGISQRKLSITHQISSATVERWYRHHIKRRISEISRRSCPRVLGIDEHFFTRKKGFATTLVDLKNHKVFDVVLGRSEPSLRQYLSRLPGRDQVRLVNQHFLKLWQQHDPVGRKNRRLLSLMRRHHWNLADDQKANLDRYLQQQPVLHALYEAK
jgi:transposase